MARIPRFVRSALLLMAMIPVILLLGQIKVEGQSLAEQFQQKVNVFWDWGKETWQSSAAYSALSRNKYFKDWLGSPTPKKVKQKSKSKQKAVKAKPRKKNEAKRKPKKKKKVVKRPQKKKRPKKQAIKKRNHIPDEEGISEEDKQALFKLLES